MARVAAEKSRIMAFMEKGGKASYSKEQLAGGLGVSPGGQHLFDFALDELVADAELVPSGKKRYALLGRGSFVKGRYMANERGFGFVERQAPEKDVYISPGCRNGALNGDIVLASLLADGQSRRSFRDNGREEGEIVRIVQQTARTLIGTLCPYIGAERGGNAGGRARHGAGGKNSAGKRERGIFAVKPDDKKMTDDIIVKREHLNGAAIGHKVMAEILERGSEGNGFKAYGKIIEVIGFTGDPGVDISAIILSHGFAQAFPDDARRAADAMPEAPDRRSYRGRRDLRQMRLITIDGEDSKDLDDAVSIELLYPHQAQHQRARREPYGEPPQEPPYQLTYQEPHHEPRQEPYHEPCQEPRQEPTLRQPYQKSRHEPATAATAATTAPTTAATAAPTTAATAAPATAATAAPATAATAAPTTAAAYPPAASALSQSPAKYRLGVHIADVSHYVKPDSPLDAEALSRGTSLYFADRVIPMLPQRLSNGVCSLHPHVDRLALSVVMDIDGSGRVVSHEIFKSVINTAERMTYKNVYSILEENDTRLSAEYAGITDDLRAMRELALILRARRLGRGALDFAFREAKITLDGNGKAIGVDAEEITVANQIIEEFMIVCNETVAERLCRAGAPFIYRTHGQPNSDKIRAFMLLAGNLGLATPRGAIGKDGNISSKALQSVISAARGTEYEKLVNTVALRSMAKAAYTVGNIGHFGLASEYYCHFTSPIRRYPDLMIHRIVKDSLLSGTLTKPKAERLAKRLPGVCAQCSERERAADEAENETEDLKKAEYMKQFEGRVFNGVISNVTSFGMFVELENTVEGLVRLANMLDGYYIFDEARYRMVGSRAADAYCIGDKVRVKLANANVATRQIEFCLIGRSGKSRKAPASMPAPR
jgi:exoribonuclease R